MSEDTAPVSDAISEVASPAQNVIGTKRPRSPDGERPQLSPVRREGDVAGSNESAEEAHKARGGLRETRHGAADRQPKVAPFTPPVFPSSPLPLTISAPLHAPSKLPRKTPVSTPSSSTRTTPPFGVPQSPSGTFSSLPLSPATLATPPSATPLSKTHRHEKWAALLTVALMLDRREDERDHVTGVSTRIATAIPGDSQEAKDTFLMLLLNLKDPKNGELRRRVIEGDLAVEVLVTLGERDLVNPERRKQLDEEFEERAKDTNLVEIRKALQTSSTLFPCPVCKVRDCTWSQKQTRSADEPMTVFCTCNKCGHMWKRF